MGKVVQTFKTIAPARRPTTHDRSVHEEYYRAYAIYMRRRCPAFVREMEDSMIVKALRLTGPPKGTAQDYANAMEDNGWCEFTDEVRVVLDQAVTIFEQVFAESVQAWVLNNKIMPPIKNGDALKYGEQSGHGYLSDKLTKSGQLLFRDENWTSLHGEKGGVLVNWEDIVMLSNNTS